MTPAPPHAPLWSEQIGTKSCRWSEGNHLGRTTLSTLPKAAQDGCVQCKLLLQGIEKYTFPPHRPHRTTEANIDEYEPNPGLEVAVFNHKEKPLRVVVDYDYMPEKSGSLPMELCFYTHPGLSAITEHGRLSSSTYHS